MNTEILVTAILIGVLLLCAVFVWRDLRANSYSANHEGMEPRDKREVGE